MAGDFDGGFCVIWAHELCDDVVVGPVVGGGWVFVQFGAVQLDSTMGQLGGAGGVGRVRASIGSVIEVLVVLIGVFGESVFGCYGDVYMTQTAHNTNRINDRAATDCPTATG